MYQSAINMRIKCLSLMICISWHLTKNHCLCNTYRIPVMFAFLHITIVTFQTFQTRIKSMRNFIISTSTMITFNINSHIMYDVSDTIKFQLQSWRALRTINTMNSNDKLPSSFFSSVTIPLKQSTIAHFPIWLVAVANKFLSWTQLQYSKMQLCFLWLTSGNCTSTNICFLLLNTTPLTKSHLHPNLALKS